MMCDKEFVDSFSDGIEMSRDTIQTATMRKHYPNYLSVTNSHNPIVLQPETRIDPTALEANSAYVYHDTLYVTDSNGGIAYMDAELKYVEKSQTKRDIAAQRKVGGSKALHSSMDAGHVLAVSLDGHPDMMQEQYSGLNRYTNRNSNKEDWQNGMFRDLERDWTQLAKDGHSLNVKAVFSETQDGSGSTYSPEWCYQVTDRTTAEKYQYNMINEGNSKETAPKEAQKSSARIIGHPSNRSQKPRSQTQR